MQAIESDVEAFTGFVQEVQPRLKRALVAALGVDVGREATAEALAYGWEHWDRVKDMENPAGYLYKVGRTRVRTRRKSPPLFPAVATGSVPDVEPGLLGALENLSERQRTAVLLVHGYGWTLTETGELLGVVPGAVQKHVERGLRKIRRALGVTDD